MSNKEMFEKYFVKFDPALLRGNEDKYLKADDNGYTMLNIPEIVKKGATFGTTTSSPFIVAVHDGQEHQDEHLAVALLTEMLHINVEVKRTRDPQELEAADFCIDVGCGILDHHGRALAQDGVCAASKVFGVLINTAIHTSGIEKYENLGWVDLCALIDRVAAIDTGHEGPIDFPFVYDYYKAWEVMKRTNEDIPEAAGPWLSSQRTVEHMLQAKMTIAFAGGDAKKAAQEDISNANDDYVIFSDEARFADVKKMLYEQKHPARWYISKEKACDYRVLCAAPLDEPFSIFGSKELIPEKYRGLSEEAFQKECGIREATFCHAKGFIAGFKTLEAAIMFVNKIVTE